MKRRGDKIKVLILLFLFSCFLFTSSALAYPIDSSSGTGVFSGLGDGQTSPIANFLNELTKSFFSSKTTALPNLQVISSGISKFIPKGYGLTFDDLVNTKSFSANDISGSLKAVGILFLKLIITTLSVTLGILRLVLDLLVRK